MKRGGLFIRFRERPGKVEVVAPTTRNWEAGADSDSEGVAQRLKGLRLVAVANVHWVPSFWSSISCKAMCSAAGCWTALRAFESHAGKPPAISLVSGRAFQRFREWVGAAIER